MEIKDYIVSTDQRLIELTLGGDKTAFDHLTNRYRDSIYQLYLQRSGGNADDAEDLVQETFIKSYLHLRSYNPKYTFGQWIYTIARNTFIDFIRRRRDDVISMDNPIDIVSGISMNEEQNPEERLISDQYLAEMDAIADKVSPKYRKLIELRFFKEYSYEEIANELAIPLGTVKTQLHRAREQLARLLLAEKGGK